METEAEMTLERGKLSRGESERERKRDEVEKQTEQVISIHTEARNVDFVGTYLKTQAKAGHMRSTDT